MTLKSKVNYVQEAYTKCFAVHILEFEIWQTTWKIKTKIIKIFYENKDPEFFMTSDL